MRTLHYQFLKNNQAFRIVDSIKIETSQGNTNCTNEDEIIILGLPTKCRKSGDKTGNGTN